MPSSTSTAPARHTPEIIAQVQALFAVAMQTPRSVADVHCEFSAHCDLVNVRGFAHGWHTNANPQLDEHVNLTWDDASERLAELHTKLSAFLEECATVNPLAADEQKARGLRETAARLIAEADALAPKESVEAGAP